MAMYFRFRALAAGDHLLDRRGPIRRGGVHVQVAANVGQRDQLGQFPRLGHFKLAPVLSQFGRNPRQPDRIVDVLLGATGHRLVVLVKHTVLVDLQPAFLGPGADNDVVLLGTGEVLHRRPVGFLGHHPQSISRPPPSRSSNLTRCFVSPWARPPRPVRAGQRLITSDDSTPSAIVANTSRSPTVSFNRRLCRPG
ncbi:MAG: hypothetical protein CM1200mP2_31190 [Planctomycetaceae bacterium]|nr:MAG: hypothetical protein CM1200mP2_31190 [Planctomycetaceae bacterium]